MAMRRMNEMWRKMALTLLLSVLALHSCQGQTDATMAHDTTVVQSAIQQTTAPKVVSSTSEINSITVHTSHQMMTATTASPTITVFSAGTKHKSPEPTVSQHATTSQMVMAETTEQGTSSPSQKTSTDEEIPSHWSPEQTNQNSQMVVQGEATLLPGPEPTFYASIACVDEAAVQGRDAVKVELTDASNCMSTMHLFKEHIKHLCVSPPCNYKLYQDVNSRNVIVTGEGVEEDIMGMKDRIAAVQQAMRVASASPIQSRQTPNVFVPVLVTGLVLAAALIGIYAWKNKSQRKAKDMKLAEASFMADEENQGNTLVSVAPLNTLESQEKTSQNGEFLESVKTQNPPTATNGHSATKSDTEL